MKKLLLAACLLYSNQIYLDAPKSFALSSPLLRAADNAGVFHTPIIDILKTRIDIVDLINGTKSWNGAIVTTNIANSHDSLSIYCRRPEIIAGATFVTISPDHKLAQTIATAQHSKAVADYIATKMSKSLYDRQMSSTNDAVFTGAYAINPFTQDRLPVYISEYAIECFDVRKNQTRLGVPAHNSKDLDFARKHNLPIKLVVDVQGNSRGNTEDLGCAAPLLDNNGNLTQAYLGEYSACITINSGVLNNMSLKDAAAHVINFLEKNNCGHAHSELLQYNHNNHLYSIKDLTKVETAIFKDGSQSAQIDALKKDLKIILNYVQADFLEIGEKFLINVENMKSLMIALIYESCELRGNNDCYLMQWAQLKGEVNAKEVFRRDITTLKGFALFSRDLVNFLGDFALSCPKAYENIRSQN